VNVSRTCKSGYAKNTRRSILHHIRHHRRENRRSSITRHRRHHRRHHRHRRRRHRARPGTEKRRPLNIYLANQTDDVCAAVARFWKETRHFQRPLGAVNEMAVWIKEFADRVPSKSGIALAPADAVARLNGSNQMLLRAAILRYYRASAQLTDDLPLSFVRMGEMQLELNGFLREQLFEGWAQIATGAEKEACAIHSHSRGGASGAGEPRSLSPIQVDMWRRKSGSPKIRIKITCIS
jgi:hypothetical protein